MSEIYDIDKLPEGNFPLSLKLIYFYQLEYCCLQAKLTCAKYQRGYFCGDRDTIELLTYENKNRYSTAIPKYILDRTEAMICQHLFWSGIIADLYKEFMNYDTFQCTKQSTKMYGKFPPK